MCLLSLRQVTVFARRAFGDGLSEDFQEWNDALDVKQDESAGDSEVDCGDCHYVELVVIDLDGDVERDERSHSHAEIIDCDQDPTTLMVCYIISPKGNNFER